jgi:ketosteroid isomerase-like protein
VKPKDFRHISAQIDKTVRPGTRQAQNVRSVQAQIEALGRGDVAGAFSTAHANLRLDIFAPPEFEWMRHASGLDAVREAVEHNLDALEDQRPEIINVLAQGDAVVLIGKEVGRMRSTGASYDLQFVHRFTFRAGRLAAMQIVVARTG